MLATVKGDIHDIGKNIVKILLENYGYQVIDFGKDVPYETVAEATEKISSFGGLVCPDDNNTPLYGKDNPVIERALSMVSTVVGGAVLTADYAEQIGADFYAKDAKETVDITRKGYSANS